MRRPKLLAMFLCCVLLASAVSCGGSDSNGQGIRSSAESEPDQDASLLSKAFTEETTGGGVVAKLLDESCQVDVDEYGRDYPEGTRYFNIGYSVKNTNPFPVYVAILGTLNGSLSGDAVQVLSESGTDFSSESFNQELFGLWFASTTEQPGEFACSEVDVSIDLIVHKCIGCRADGSWKGIPAIQDCLTLKCATPASTTTTTAARQSPSADSSIDTGDWFLNYKDLGVVTQRINEGDWIAVLASIDSSLPLNQIRSAVTSTVDKLHARDIDGPGNVLLSSSFPGLRPGYVVVYAGPYASSQSASGFCTMAELPVPTECYLRSPIP